MAMKRVIVDAAGQVLATHDFGQDIGPEAYATAEREAFLAYVPAEEVPRYDSLTGPGRLTPEWRELYGEAPVPDEINARQGRIELIHAGLFDKVEAAIAAIADEKERRIAQEKFSGGSWSRDDPLFTGLAKALGLSPEQVDGLWRNAAARR